MTIKGKMYPEARFGGFTDLDVGCERGSYNEDMVPLRRNLRILKGKVAKVIGIDVDKDAHDNPFLDEFYQIQNDSWPVESNSIDLIVCDNVLEHMQNPDMIFLEIRRVLKNDGYLYIRTPNRWSYIVLAATLIPNKYHSK